MTILVGVPENAAITSLTTKTATKTFVTEINLLEKTTIEPLRNYQHKDVKGNLISE